MESFPQRRVLPGAVARLGRARPLAAEMAALLDSLVEK